MLLKTEQDIIIRKIKANSTKKTENTVQDNNDNFWEGDTECH